MSTSEIAYLAMVLAAFAFYAGCLAFAQRRG